MWACERNAAEIEHRFSELDRATESAGVRTTFENQRGFTERDAGAETCRAGADDDSRRRRFQAPASRVPGAVIAMDRGSETGTLFVVR